MLTKTYTFVVLVAVILASSLVELKAKEEIASLEEVTDELALLDEEDLLGGDKEDMVGDKEDIKDRELSGYGYGGYDNDYYGDNDHYSRPVRRPTRYYYGGNHGGSYYGSRPVRKPVRKPVRRYKPSYWNY